MRSCGSPRNAGSAQVWKDCQLAARELDLQLHSVKVNSADDFEGAFKSASQVHSAAILVTQMILANTNRSKLVEMAAKALLPAIYWRPEFVAEGGLMSYGADLNDQYRRVASYVDKILKGANPADLPVEQPARFELVINGKTKVTRHHDSQHASGAGEQGDRVKPRMSALDKIG